MIIITTTMPIPIITETGYNGNRVGVAAVAAAVVVVTAAIVAASVVVTAATAVVVIVKCTYGKAEQKRHCYCRNKCYNNLLHKFLPIIETVCIKMQADIF